MLWILSIFKNHLISQRKFIQNRLSARDLIIRNIIIQNYNTLQTLNTKQITKQTLVASI